MTNIEFTKPYSFAHHGYETMEYALGQIVEASDELAESALKDKVAKKTKKEASNIETVAANASPETVAAEAAPEIEQPAVPEAPTIDAAPETL